MPAPGTAGPRPDRRAVPRHEGVEPRAPHATDRRTHQLHLTELGRARYEDALPAVQRREAELEVGLTPEQCDAAFTWMSALSTACQETGRS